MPRYFIAIPLPDDARDRLVAVQPPAIPGMRILAREELHLTLHFLGEVAANELGAVRAALATVRRDAFTINVSRVGMFSSERHAKVLWAGVEANAGLTELHRAIGVVLTDAIGFRPEERPYTPHITLARLDDPAFPGAVERYLEDNRGFVVPSVRIDRLILFSSRFVDNVPKYQEEAAFSLGPASTLPSLAANLAQGDFIAYLGPAAIHDGVVTSVRHRNASLAVTIRGADETVISVFFQNVIEVQENRPEDMMLYALAEYRHRGGGRFFIFANWDDEDDAALSVIAEKVTFQSSHEGSSAIHNAFRSFLD